MDIVERMLSGEKIAIGMVHLLPLPGTLHYGGNFQAILDQAVSDAKKLEEANFDALIVENVNDAPFEYDSMTPLQLYSLAIVCDHVRRSVSIPMGIDACGESVQGIYIGALTGASFVRVPYFVDIRIGQNGLINPCGYQAVMTRKRAGLEHIRILADIQVKHTYPLCENIPVEASASWAKAIGADAIIVTGLATGMETPIETMQRVKAVVDLPVVVGSGMNASNTCKQFEYCDGAIVGTAVKEQGSLMRPVDKKKAVEFMEAAKEAKNETDRLRDQRIS